MPQVITYGNTLIMSVDDEPETLAMMDQLRRELGIPGDTPRGVRRAAAHKQPKPHYTKRKPLKRRKRHA